MRNLFTALAALLIASPALAQNLGPLESLSACRLDAGRVVLDFSYWGGACEEIEPLEVKIYADTAKVSLPRRSTSEVCTAQAVEMRFAGIVEAGASVTGVDVFVLNTDGEPQSAGFTAVAPGSPECVEPPSEQE